MCVLIVISSHLTTRLSPFIPPDTQMRPVILCVRTCVNICDLVSAIQSESYVSEFNCLICSLITTVDNKDEDVQDGTGTNGDTLRK